MNTLLQIIKEEIFAFVNEIGEIKLQPYSWTKTRQKFDSKYYYFDYYYRFTTEDGDNYQVTIYHDPAERMWNVSFLANQEKGGKFSDIINKGKLFKVMSTVVNIVKDFINEEDPKEIEIVPTKNDEEDNRRFEMYLQYIKKNAPTNYRIVSRNYGDNPKILLVRKN
jgi:hypothetical protein